jgi:hypothetical protein
MVVRMRPEQTARAYLLNTLRRADPPVSSICTFYDYLPNYPSMIVIKYLLSAGSWVHNVSLGSGRFHPHDDETRHKIDSFSNAKRTYTSSIIYGYLVLVTLLRSKTQEKEWIVTRIPMFPERYSSLRHHTCSRSRSCSAPKTRYLLVSATISWGTYYISKTILQLNYQGQ